MIPKPAQYLLRCDDLCPTLAPTPWKRIQELIAEFGIRPILAVIPENADLHLELAPPDPEFWNSMRSMQEAGATIAMHGFRHLCETRAKSILQLHRRTEFAGVPEELQREWLRTGLGILKSHGLQPKVWVAPRHGFDAATLRALRKEGLSVLSDGFTRTPIMYGGVTWIPQQLWGPVEKSKGLWTICLHSNSTHREDLEALRAFLQTHAGQFTSVERVLAEYPLRPAGIVESVYAALAVRRVRARYARRRRKQRH